MASIVGGALRRQEEEERQRKVRQGAQARIEERMRNVSGGDVGRAVGTVGGAVGALAAGQPQLIGPAARVGGDVLQVAGKAIDKDESVGLSDVANLTATAASVASDKDGLKALKELLGKTGG